MRTQLDKLLVYINARLATAGLTLSEKGKEAIYERWNKSEATGGYSEYWRTL